MRAANAAFKMADVEYPAGSFIIPVNQAGARRRALASRRRSRRSAWPRSARDAAGRADARRRSAAPGDYSTWGNTQEVGWVRHALRSVRGAVRFDLQGARPQGRPPRRLRRHPRSRARGAPAKGLVYDIDDARQAAAVHEERPRSRRSASTASRRTSAAAWASRASSSCRSSSRPAARSITLGVASFFPAEFGLLALGRPQRGRRRSSTRRDRSSQAEILKPAHPIFYGYRDAGCRCATPTARCCRCRKPIVSEQVLMRFVGGDASVLSGLLRGATEIATAPPSSRAPVGQGDW